MKVLSIVLLSFLLSAGVVIACRPEPSVIPSVAPSPEISLSPTVTIEVTPTVKPTSSPSATQENHGDGLSDGKSDGLCSLPPCITPGPIVPNAPPATGRGGSL